MEMFRGRTADDVWKQAHRAVMASSTPTQASRAGDTQELLHVALEIEDPRQRWVVSRLPALNPAFAIAKAVWMLAGDNDSSVLNYWFPGLPKFAGSGPTYTGAYGHRLRHHFGIDQVRDACNALASNPTSRQVVLQIWDVASDLPGRDGSPRHQDIPCNVTSLLKVRDKRLDWTQVMRSNDLHRGLPHNVIQFTVLQEVMAGWLGVDVGTYHHWSDSLHAYRHDLDKFTVDATVTPCESTDSLATDFQQGQALVGELHRRLVALTAPELSASDLAALTLLPGAPGAYRNLLHVLGAESARRRGNADHADEIMATCSNPQLVQLWAAWSQRMQSGT